MLFVASIIVLIFNPAAFKALTADSLPLPGPFILTSIFTNPRNRASSAALSAACAAAKGVFFFEPLKPKAPALDQDIAFPYLSAKVTIVLLNVD